MFFLFLLFLPSPNMVFIVKRPDVSEDLWPA